MYIYIYLCTLYSEIFTLHSHAPVESSHGSNSKPRFSILLTVGKCRQIWNAVVPCYHNYPASGRFHVVAAMHNRPYINTFLSPDNNDKSLLRYTHINNLLDFISLPILQAI